MGTRAGESGESGDTLSAARAALAARDADLADADRMLSEAVAAAHSEAVESINRIEAIRAAVDAAAAGQSMDSPAAAREFSRFLIAQEREVAAVVTAAGAAAQAKVVVLQQLRGRYRLQDSETRPQR